VRRRAGLFLLADVSLLDAQLAALSTGDDDASRATKDYVWPDFRSRRRTSRNWVLRNRAARSPCRHVHALRCRRNCARP